MIFVGSPSVKYQDIKYLKKYNKNFKKIMEPSTTLAPIKISFISWSWNLDLKKCLTNNPFFLVGVNFQKMFRIQDFSFLIFQCIFEIFHNFNIWLRRVYQNTKTGFLVYLYEISKCPGISKSLPHVLAHRMLPILRY